MAKPIYVAVFLALSFLLEISCFRHINAITRKMVVRNNINEIDDGFSIVEPNSDSSPSLSTKWTDLQLRNRAIGVMASALGSFIFFFQHTQPVSGVALLNAMAQDSIPLERALCNGKPTIIDFYADWCESCKAMAPTMRRMEVKYSDKVNFVVVDGGSYANSNLVGAFGVDGIPHLAFISPKGEVKTALIGAVPEKIVDAQISALSNGRAKLPYEGYDAFEGMSHFPFSDSSSLICKKSSL